MANHDLQRYDLLAMRITAGLAILALVARILIVPVMAEARAGAVPICGAGKITWVTVDGDTLPDGSEVSDPCPYFGLAGAPAMPGPSLPVPGASWHVQQSLSDDAQCDLPMCPRTVRTRGPPEIT